MDHGKGVCADLRIFLPGPGKPDLTMIPENPAKRCPVYVAAGRRLDTVRESAD